MTLRPTDFNVDSAIKRDATSHISHILGAKYKFVILQSSHVAKSSLLQTKHASKSYDAKIYH